MGQQYYVCVIAIGVGSDIDSVASDYDVYEITYQVRGETHKLTVLRSAGNVIIGGLDAGTRYSFTIVAKNADGKDTITARNGKENLATSTIRVTTQGFTAARAVPFLKRASATPDLMSLQWRVPTARMPAGTTIRYVVEVFHDTRRMQPVTHAEIGEIVGTTITITNLSPNTRYTFVVRAVATVPGLNGMLSETFDLISANRIINVRTAR